MDHILNLIDSSLSYDQHSFKVQSKGIKSQILSGSVRFQKFSYYVKNHIVFLYRFHNLNQNNPLKKCLSVRTGGEWANLLP